MKDRLKKGRVFEIVDRFSFLFFWVKWFYPATDMHLAYMLYAFVPQKIFRFNGRASWPMHFTSRVINPENVTLGKNSAPGLSAGCYIQAKGKVVLGNNVLIGPNVGLISANHAEDSYDEWILSSVTIGNDVWIGMNSVVLPGVTIGDNSIIGAGSVVTKDIPPNSVAAGNPCCVIRAKKPYRVS